MPIAATDITKRTHRNQYLGPFIKHEMNRCIACYRCVRFYRDYAGGHDLDVYAAHNDVYFGREADGALESEFSGNLVEVCPTGVFTDKTLSSAYNRKWDMRSLPSICVHCGVGCNTNVSERAGQVRRILNRFNGAVNGYFLCDRGRFGYGFANAGNRPRTAHIRARGGAATQVAKTEVLDKLGKLLKVGNIIGIGSPRASLEANFALRTLVGAEAFYPGISAQEAECLATIIDVLGVVKTPTLHEVEAADAILVLGEDIANTAPRVALALQQAVRTRSMEIADRLKIPHWQDAAVREAAQDVRSPLFIATPAKTRLDDIATEPYRAAPDDIARFGHAICHFIDTDRAHRRRTLGRYTGGRRTYCAGIVGRETSAHCIRVPVGQPCNPACGSLHRASPPTGRPYARHSLRRTRVQQPWPCLDARRQRAERPGGGRDGLWVIVLENDLYRRADRPLVDALLNSAATTIVLDNIQTETLTKADIVLPCANFAESEGSFVNAEGRAQRFFKAVFRKDDVQPSWLWLRDLADAAERMK